MDGQALCFVTDMKLSPRATLVANIGLDAGPPVRAIVTVVTVGDQPMRRGTVYAGRWRVPNPQDRARLLDALRELNGEGDLPPPPSVTNPLPRQPHRFMHAPAPGGGALYISVQSADELRRLVCVERGEVRLHLPRIPQLGVGDRPRVALQLHDGIVIDLLPEVTGAEEASLHLVDAQPTASVRAILMRVFKPERDPPSLISVA